ncbi:hypothetical protein VNI00_003706 [Paramarasmius palmivorus]|uniref:GST N-terminal domain-containing protein n=1 Tax=Paramarasmius palmivorus TaxID=297713 RepID=A0AAW0DSC8_9AGAR
MWIDSSTQAFITAKRLSSSINDRMITVYDLGPCRIPGVQGFSGSARTVIYILKYKGIPFTVSLVDWATLEPTAKSIGAPPTLNKPGNPKYAVPFIHDTTTGRSISHSFNIAEYLEATYPDTPRVFPEGTRVLQVAFCELLRQKLGNLILAIWPSARDLLTPEFEESFKKNYGHLELMPPLTPEETEVLWKRGEKGYDELAQGYREGQLFVMGDEPVFADFGLAGEVWACLIAFEKGSDGWKRLSGLMGGRWGRLMEYMEKLD